MHTLAVIGMGSIAKRHIANLRSLHPNALIYVISASGNNTELPKHADAIITFDELVQKKPNYVIVATPASTHVTYTKRLLAHQIPVLIEKPLAESSQSCISLLEQTKGANSPLMAVGYCLRFLPSALVVKHAIDAALLGQIYNVSVNVGQFLPSWRLDKSYKESVSASKVLGGGALLELSHELDYLQWFFGALELKYSLLRTTNELGLDVEEIANLVLLNAQQIHIHVHLDFIQKSVQRKCELIGEHGRLEWDLVNNRVLYHHSQGLDTLYSEPNYDKNGMYIDMLQAFERKMTGQASQLASIDEASSIIELIDKAKQTNSWR